MCLIKTLQSVYRIGRTGKARHYLYSVIQYNTITFNVAQQTCTQNTKTKKYTKKSSELNLTKKTPVNERVLMEQIVTMRQDVGLATVTQKVIEAMG